MDDKWNIWKARAEAMDVAALEWSIQDCIAAIQAEETFDADAATKYYDELSVLRAELKKKGRPMKHSVDEIAKNRAWTQQVRARYRTGGLRAVQVWADNKQAPKWLRGVDVARLVVATRRWHW